MSNEMHFVNCYLHAVYGTQQHKMAINNDKIALLKHYFNMSLSISIDQER